MVTHNLDSKQQTLGKYISQESKETAQLKKSYTKTNCIKSFIDKERILEERLHYEQLSTHVFPK